jgi:ribosomal protein L12E/L44/L45/RPP1/RPP2
LQIENYLESALRMMECAPDAPTTENSGETIADTSAVAEEEEEEEEEKEETIEQ